MEKMEAEKLDDECLTSDSESSSDDEKDEEQLKLEIKIFQDQIMANELNYNAHVGLISLLRKAGDLEQLRDARKRMNKIYPLSPDLWLDWISDEQKICTTEEERKDIIDLFEKAVSEYTSVKVWVEYITFMSGGGDHSATQSVCEKALMSVGIHVSEGLLVWQAVLLVEQQILLALQKGEKEFEEQKKKIQNLYHRQSRIPLMNNEKEEFLSDASPWFDGSIDPQIQKNLDKSLAKLDEFIPFEIEILRAEDDNAKYKAYEKYLDHIEKKENPAVVGSLYERAVTDFCLNAGLWENYVTFSLKTFPSADYIILPLCERSQNNCPWSANLCSLRITALEKFSENLSKNELLTKIKGCLETTLSSGINNDGELIKAWMPYLVFLRRRIQWENEDHLSDLNYFREACEQAREYVDQNVEGIGDPECELARFQAKIEAESARNIEGTRTIWNDYIMKKNENYKNVNLWLEFINLERSFGDIKHCRKLFRRAMERVWDFVEVIGREYLKFEQEVGTVESMSDFEKRYKDRMNIVKKKREDDILKEEEAKQKGKSKKRPQKEIISPKKKEIRKEIANEPKPSQISGKNMTDAPAGYKRIVEDIDEKPAKKPKVETTHGEHIEHDSSKDFRTVFLSNMDYSTGEEIIRDVFKDCGEIAEIRLTKDFKGRSKGFGYLEFTGPAAVPKALALDRTPVGMRPLFVSPCNPSNRVQGFKYSTSLEMEKLFIRGLPFRMKENEVKDVFEQHGKVKSIRLVTHRNGYSKGTAYVEFYDEQTAEKVRQIMDGSMLEGFKLTVLISNPSATKMPKTSAPPSLPGHAINTGHQRPKLSFVPRALLRKNTENAPKAAINGTSKQNGAEEKPEERQGSSGKSNEDFRKMFLG